MKKMISALLVLAMMLALFSGCGDNSGGVNVDTSDLYKQVMARFDGKLEEDAVIKVLENDTAVELGYVDALVFTAGVGENTPCVREAICENMQYLGLEIDKEKNLEKNNGSIRDITGKNSKVKVLIIPTNEELVIARETVELL